MGLKIQLNGQRKTINTTTHKPVIFIGGQKKTLVKGVTFVNGQKKVLWGISGVKHDKIIVPNAGTLLAIGEKWATLNHGSNIVRVNMDNLSDPTVIQTVAWGSAIRNGWKSTSSYVFDAQYSTTYNILDINPQSGAVSVTRSLASTGGGSLKSSTGSYFVSMKSLTKSFVKPGSSTGSSGIITRTYGTQIYFDNSVRITTGSAPSSSTDTSTILTASGGVQISDSQLICNFSGSKSPGTGTYIIDYNGYTQKSSSTTSITSYIRSRNLFVSYSAETMSRAISVSGGSSTSTVGNTCIVFRDSVSLAIVGRIYADTNKKVIFLGENDGNFYVIHCSDTEASLWVIDPDTYQVIYETPLDADPFGDGVVWTKFMHFVPMVSLNGYLGICYNTGSETHIVRFTALL